MRIFDINEDGTFETTFYTYEQICGKSLWNELCYIWDADGMWKAKTALIAGGVAAVGALIGIGITLNK